MKIQTGLSRLSHIFRRMPSITLFPFCEFHMLVVVAAAVRFRCARKPPQHFPGKEQCAVVVASWARSERTIVLTPVAVQRAYVYTESGAGPIWDSATITDTQEYCEMHEIGKKKILLAIKNCRKILKIARNY